MCTYPVLSKMEDVLGREVQPEELQQAVMSMQGKSATVLQLANAVDGSSASATDRTAGSDSFMGEEWVGDQADLHELLAGVYLSQLSQDGEEEGSEQEQCTSEGDGGDDFDELQLPALRLLQPQPQLPAHDADWCIQGQGYGSDGLEGPVCCSSPRADLVQAGSSPMHPSARSTPTPNVPSLSLGMLRKSIRVVSAK